MRKNPTRSFLGRIISDTLGVALEAFDERVLKHRYMKFCNLCWNVMGFGYESIVLTDDEINELIAEDDDSESI